MSTGAIASWIDWQLTEPIAATPPGTLSIRRDRVRSVAGDLAWVDLEASVQLPGATYPIGSPAVALRSPDGWKVLDYSWGSRDQAEAVFANARGSKTVGSVTLTVFGAVLQADSVDVYASIENGSDQALDLQAADALVTSDARTLGGLTPYATGPIAPGGSQRLNFLLVGRGLPVTTTEFLLAAKIYTDPGYSVLAFDVPVILSP